MVQNLLAQLDGLLEGGQRPAIELTAVGRSLC
jgi:hypothetical protein